MNKDFNKKKIFLYHSSVNGLLRLEMWFWFFVTALLLPLTRLSIVKAGDMIFSQEEISAVLLLVDSTLSTQLGASYTTYKEDLTNEGYVVIEETVNSNTQPPQIKEIIYAYYSSTIKLSGVILIGNLKAPYAIVRTGDYSNPDSLKVWLSLDPVDMYYCDLDGNWDHFTKEEFHDIISNPPSNVTEITQYSSCGTFQDEYLVSFDKEKEWDYQSITNKSRYSIEIWVARIMGHNLSIPGKTETDILNDYFTWNHTFRTGRNKIYDTGYLLNAIGSGFNDQGMDYSGIFTDVVTGENVSRTTYLNYLQSESGSKLMYLTAHSWPKGHSLSDSSVITSDLLNIQKNVVFYLLNTCSACRWDEYVSDPVDPNYLGGLYVFDKSHTNGDYGLGAIGFTGVGGFNNLNYFTDYYYDNPGARYGEMYVFWFNQNQQINFNMHNYVFLGDPTIGLDTPIEGTSVSDSPEQIKEYHLSQNYPNPFNPTTNISFTIPNQCAISLKIYNILGEEVDALINSNMLEAGHHRITWDAVDLPSGIYFYQLEVADHYTAIRKCVLMK